MVNHICEPISSNQFASCSSARVEQGGGGAPLTVDRNAKITTLANFPMQANGAEMLRLACCYAINRNIPIVAPIHDAILIEADIDAIRDTTEAMRQGMEDASRAVLGGHTVRVDASEPLIYPNRYVDGRNVALWDTTLRLLEKVKSNVTGKSIC
jgi:DNA polymerase-1